MYMYNITDLQFYSPCYNKMGKFAFGQNAAVLSNVVLQNCWKVLVLCVMVAHGCLIGEAQGVSAC